MKKPIGTFVASLTFLSLIVLASLTQADDKKPSQGPCVTVAKGGVGESGATSLLHHQSKAKTEKLIVLRNVKTSLCANTGAIAILVINGEPKAHGLITQLKSSIQAPVNPGDHVIAIVHAIPLFNQIVCVRLGELYFEMDECDLVK